MSEHFTSPFDMAEGFCNSAELLISVNRQRSLFAGMVIEKGRKAN